MRPLILLFMIIATMSFRASATDESNKLTIVVIDVSIDELLLWQQDVFKLLLPDFDNIFYVTARSFPRLNSMLSNRKNHCGIGSNAPESIPSRVMLGKAIVGNFYIFKAKGSADVSFLSSPILAMRSKAIDEHLAKSQLSHVQVESRSDVGRLLKSGRFIHWLENIMLFDYMRDTYDLPEFERIRHVGTIENWLSCSKTTAPEIINKVGAAWKKYKYSKELQQLYYKYKFYDTYPFKDTPEAINAREAK